MIFFNGQSCMESSKYVPESIDGFLCYFFNKEMLWLHERKGSSHYLVPAIRCTTSKHRKYSRDLPCLQELLHCTLLKTSEVGGAIESGAHIGNGLLHIKTSKNIFPLKINSLQLKCIVVLFESKLCNFEKRLQQSLITFIILSKFTDNNTYDYKLIKKAIVELMCFSITFVKIREMQLRKKQDDFNFGNREVDNL